VNNVGGSFSIYYIGADIEHSYEELRRNGAIKLETEGEDSRMEQIVQAAYTKLTEIMFQEVHPEDLSKDEQDGVGKVLSDMIGGKGNFSSEKMTGFGLHAVYKKKNIKTSGSSIMYFSSRTSADRHHYITFNIGDFYKKYGDNEDYIKNISMVDPPFHIRNIAVAVDATLLPEFDKLINNITIRLRKQHQGGTTTVDEVNLSRTTMDKDNRIYLSYPNEKDTDALGWLDYEYNAQFSLRGGKSWETGWQKQNAAMINLYTPYERRIILLEGDADSLRAKNVRATTVKVEYPFLGEIKTFEITVKPEDDLSQKQFEITLPAGQFNYKYTLRWQLKNGSQKTVSGETDAGILFIDGVPPL
jgi:hypothetical protein